MSIILIKNIGVPIIKQIINSVELAVVNKILKKGDKLPSVNSIRNKYSISRDTVFSALKTVSLEIEYLLRILFTEGNLSPFLRILLTTANSTELIICLIIGTPIFLIKIILISI